MADSSSTVSLPAEVVRVVVLGAGSSSSTPKMGCISGASPCSTCAEARLNPDSRNHRLNPSLLIQVRRPSTSEGSSSTASAYEPYSIHSASTDAKGNKNGCRDGQDECAKGLSSSEPSQVSPPVHPNPVEYLNILIDCGKTFRETSLRHFKPLGVENLHALLLTHNHADAAFGIDDLREFTGTHAKVSLPVYLDPRTDATMRRVFGYLYPKTAANDGRWVATLEWTTFEQGTEIPVRARGPDRQVYANPDDRPAKEAILDLTLPIISMPIEHGPGYMSNGFVFELSKGHVFVYFSDISRYDEGDDERLRAIIGDRVLEILVLDLLSVNPYFSHFSRDQAVACAAKIKAKHTYFVGMSHTLEYNKTNKTVKSALGKEGLVGELAFDGCVVYDALNSR